PTLAQNLVDLADHVLADDAPQPHRGHVLGWDHDGHVVLQDPKHVELLFGPRNDLGLDALNDTNAVSRVHDLLADLEHRIVPSLAPKVSHYPTLSWNRQITFIARTVGRTFVRHAPSSYARRKNAAQSAACSKLRNRRQLFVGGGTN